MLDLRLEYEYLKDDIDSAIKDCLEQQKWILGPQVKDLEIRIAEYLGVKRCVGVSSGTEALVLSLRALAIKIKNQEYFDKSDLIITTPFTFTATGDAILRAGATPVFVDIDKRTFNIDVKKIEDFIESQKGNKNCRIAGIIPVHLYGQACDMDKLSAIAEKNKIFMLEDVAQAFGGMWNGRKLGSLGVAAAFSFFPSKNLGGFGDGGMIATNDPEIAELVTMLLKHGGKDKYNVDHIGYNARLDTIQAAVLLAKFGHINEFNERKRKTAQLYDAGLAGLDDLVLPVVLPQAHHVYHQYTVYTSKRDQLQAYLKENNIATMIYYPFPLHKMNVFNNINGKVHNNPINAEDVSTKVLSLPVGPFQSGDETNYIIDCVRKFFKR
jgi:dTDP-4-amino-4,6-dideoxygalactose transaminase